MNFIEKIVSSCQVMVMMAKTYLELELYDYETRVIVIIYFTTKTLT